MRPSQQAFSPTADAAAFDRWVPVEVVRFVAALIYAILGVITMLGYSRVSL
jgi:hypothetical protein